MGTPQFLQAAGLLAGFAVTVHAWHLIGGSRREAAQRLILASPLVFVGGKAWYLAENGLAPTAANLRGPGYSLYGSVALVLLFWFLWNWIRPFPFLRFLDAVTPGAAVGLVFGRLSCFLRGCCSGLPTGGAWGVRLSPSALFYPEYVVRGWTESNLGTTVPLHPTQLYGAGFALIAFALLLRTYKRPGRSGRVFLCGVLAYGVFRFFLEYCRIHDSSAIMLGGFYLTQWVSLAAAGLAALGLWTRRRPSSTAFLSAERSSERRSTD
jgi:prolipoprotein diacylglyceryltransferase